MNGVVKRAQQWLAHDPDPATRAELATVIDAATRGHADAAADLSDRFSGPLEFGTAGLRGAVGAGESRMNVAVIVRTTAGLASYLRDVVGDDARVVVGCDARLGSADFRTAALGVLDAAGVDVIALPPRLPTPVVAYATRALNCDAGIMITASHNPAADNGYKVYLGGRAADTAGRGVQIVSPADADIARHIHAAPPADKVPMSDAASRTQVADDVVDAYIDRVASLRSAISPSPVRVVLTPLHGVGGGIATRVLAKAGIADVHRVVTQFDPDPDFPTVAFPNPEEPGALDAAIALARKTVADVVVALDPDADRCAVAIPGRDGRWRQLSGDEVGALLAEQAATDPDRAGDTLACSIVSSRLLAHIAESHGLRHAVTLTGFKWIARTPGLRFGYEEAIGYCTDPDAVRDKDGISTMIRVLTLVETAAAGGRTLDDLLDDLARRHGVHATGQLSFRVENTDTITEVMRRLRRDGIDRLAGSAVTEVVDLADGGSLPPTDGLVFHTADDDRVIIRPSGTEPKLKCYLEVVRPCDDAAAPIPLAAAHNRLATLRRDVAAALDL
ncbi:phospho-sugar mutase [Gordonia sp. ABSL49_1]|uniref:phospho-sugar mutase n=1 Tax=Gordonia sp. ABSL49_1 TaxID=2920941 RepID=UPI001F0E8A98|nr:phospho-sugar mutase [Gordonia sp. ABSL49_1]MCH5642761.1 phospho-sugar mutase [Gordonia sp. ABSL49_1]